MTNKEKILRAALDAILFIQSIEDVSGGFIRPKRMAIQALKDIPHLVAGMEADVYLKATMEAL